MTPVLLLGTVSLALAGGLPQLESGRHGRPLVKNIIVMISDGCGYNHIEAANLWAYGVRRAQPYEFFPFRAGMSTYADDPAAADSYDPYLAWNDFDYVKQGPTDSAAAATAMACGVKTYNAALGGIGDGTPGGFISAPNLMERSEELGRATGVVSTVQWSHATPAGYVAHQYSRNNYDKVSQEMLLLSRCEVIMGAGHPWFNDSNQALAAPGTFKYVGGNALWNLLIGAGSFPVSGLDINSDGVGESYANWSDCDGDGVADPWTLVQSRAQFQALTSGPAPKRVCGTAQVATTTQQNRGGDKLAAPYVVPPNPGVPTLAEMSRGALNVLAQNRRGFTLMVEGGAVDWAGHANQSGRLIEEEMDFNHAVLAVMAWITRTRSWGDTLLIVTGDHETGYLLGPGSGAGSPLFRPLQNNGFHQMPGMQWNSGDHTNSLIPVFAAGAHAMNLWRYCRDTDPVRGRYLDNTEVADFCFWLLGD